MLEHHCRSLALIALTRLFSQASILFINLNLSFLRIACLNLVISRHNSRSYWAEQSTALARYIDLYHIVGTVVGMFWNTTASNTGKNKVSRILLEPLIGTFICYLACSHHIYEMHIHHADEKVRGVTYKGPDELFLPPHPIKKLMPGLSNIFFHLSLVFSATFFSPLICCLMQGISWERNHKDHYLLSEWS